MTAFTRWHGGVARGRYADEWLRVTGPLSRPEADAVTVLRTALLADHGGCALIRRLASGDPTVSEPVLGAVDTLAPRALRVVQAAQPALLRWQADLQGSLPAWFDCMRAALDRFFGESGGHLLRVYLLPSAEGSVSGNGDMFVEEGGLDMGGHEVALTTALHEGIHSIYQRRILNPLVAAALATPDGERVEDLRRDSPVPFNMASYVGELVAGALEGGVLREHCGLGSQAAHWRGVTERARHIPEDATFEGWDYGAWVGLGAAEMIPIAKRYLDEARIADADLVRAALAIFEATDRMWRAAHAPKSSKQATAK